MPTEKEVFTPVQEGVSWTSRGAMNGLGGVGAQVGMGELRLKDPTAQQATLTLGLQPINTNVALGDGRIYAKVVYGIGVANQTVFLDWSQGNSITLPVGKVTLTALQADEKGAPWLPMPAGYVQNPASLFNTGVILTATLARGPRSSLGFPTLTQTVSMAPIGPITWHAPARVKRVLVGEARGQAGSDVTAQVSGALGFNLFQLSNAADSAIRTEGVIVQSGADVTLASPGGVFGVTLCWLLDG